MILAHTPAQHRESKVLEYTISTVHLENLMAHMLQAYDVLSSVSMFLNANTRNYVGSSVLFERKCCCEKARYYILCISKTMHFRERCFWLDIGRGR